MLSQKSTVRVYSPFFPYPPNEGAFQVAFDQLRSLHQLGFKVELVFWKEGLSSALRKLNTPYPEAFPAEITLISLREAAEQETRWQRLARVLGSLLTFVSSPEMYYYPLISGAFANSEIAEKLSKLAQKPADLGIYHYSFAYSWLRKARNRREKRTAVYFLNLESDLFTQRKRETSFTRILNRAVHALNSWKLRRHETEIAQYADELWFISPQDQSDYESRTSVQSRARSIRLVPPSFSPKLRLLRNEAFSQQSQNFAGSLEQKMILGFVGALDFGPNEASAFWIVDQLGPVLKERGFLGEVWIAGKHPSLELRCRAEMFPFIKLLGFVPDLEDFWARLSFSLAPHVLGSGVRMKILESMASGIPVLTTQAGASRLNPPLLSDPLLFVHDDPVEWVGYILREPPFRLRERLSDGPFSQGLNRALIYDFL